MKNPLKICLFTLVCLITSTVLANDYYFDSEKGSDQNKGKSIAKAFRSFAVIKHLNLKGGDRLLLANGSVFRQMLLLKKVTGEKNNPIIIENYLTEGSRSIPVIDASTAHHGILLVDCSFIEIKNIEIATLEAKKPSNFYPILQNIRCGVLVLAESEGHYQHFEIENITVKNLFYEDPGFRRGKDEVRTANGTQNYGWGIRFINRNEKAIITDVKVRNNHIENIAHTGIKFTSTPDYGIKNIEIANNSVKYTGGPGIQLSRAENGWIHQNSIDHSGSNNDSRKWGRGSGLWTWGSKNFIIEHNQFLNANGPGDSAGAHIDFNCNDIVLQYNFSANNAGGFIEILGENYNCAYRYNISVNDGHRVKGENGAFQEGKTFWLSGFRGKGTKRNGPFNSYIYNNTIYVNSDIVAKVAIDKASKGILVANNIFYIMGESKSVLGDQYNPEVASNGKIEEVFFENNLFLKKENWPEDQSLQDKNPIYGDPQFSNPGATEATAYIPKNIQLIKDKGINIELLSGDSIGIKGGLILKKDILGNIITDQPDLGAIEIGN